MTSGRDGLIIEYMDANEIKTILAESESRHAEPNRLYKIHDLRVAGFDYQTARFIVEHPDWIELFATDQKQEKEI